MIAEKLRELADEADTMLEGMMPESARSDHGTITLGGLIDLLKNRDQSERVEFDFCGFGPDGLHSYRGYYNHLAIGYRKTTWRDGEDMTVGQLREKLEAAVGKTFEGYKGGDFTMNPKTPVWVADSDEAGGTGIVGLVAGSICYFLLTKHFD